MLRNIVFKNTWKNSAFFSGGLFRGGRLFRQIRYESKIKSWDTDKKCPKLRHLPICRRRRSHNLWIRQRWRYIPCNNVLCPYIILWNKKQQIDRGLLNCANRDMQRKKERKNLRSSETAAPHVGSIKKTSFAIKSETRLQSDFRILKFQFRVFSNFFGSQFREFFEFFVKQGCNRILEY